MTDRGRVVTVQPIAVAPGDRKTVDLWRQPDSRVTRSIIRALPKTGGFPGLGGTAGQLADWDPSLWLTLLGASRIIQPAATVPAWEELSLDSLSDVEPGNGVVFVLAGLEHGDTISIGIGLDANHEQIDMQAVDSLEGVHHLCARCAPGPRLVSVKLPNVPCVTYATQVLPDRAALVVVSVAASGQIVMRQMLLPIHALEHHLPPLVAARFAEERLGLIKYLTIAQQLFATRQSLAPATAEDRDRWSALLNGKWIDPLLAIMAIFDATRRGDGRDANLQEAARNLLTYFSDLPDVHVAAHALDATVPPPAGGTPLLLESLQRLPKLKSSLPIEPGALDYGSMWTSWWRG